MTTDTIDLFTDGVRRVVKEGHRVASIEAEEMDDGRIMVTAEDALGSVLVAVIMEPLTDGSLEDLRFGMGLLAQLAQVSPLHVRRATA